MFGGLARADGGQGGVRASPIGAAGMYLNDTHVECPRLIGALGPETYPKAAQPGNAVSVIRDSL